MVKDIYILNKDGSKEMIARIRFINGIPLMIDYYKALDRFNEWIGTKK